jgi:Ca-activated chloride channel family protein
MRHSRRAVFASLIATLLCSIPIAAQAPSEATADARMVVLNVRVTDAESHAVLDVNGDAFSVVEDGVPQKITFFSKEEVPVSYGLVIDNSGSLRSQLDKVIQSGVKIVNSNKVGDETFLIRFISSDKIETVQDVTADKHLLIDGLTDLYVEGGQTAVIDAVYLAADKLSKQKFESLHRRALILVTDGEDRRSFYKQEKLFELLGQSDIQIYVVAFTGELKGKAQQRATELLKRLATDTGGRAFFPQSKADLGRIADEIINDIRTQYLVGYVPVNQKAPTSFHKVEVSIAGDPNKDKRIAITRIGYTAPKVSN